VSWTVLEKHCAFGFQIQDVEGTEKSDNVLWVPFRDTLDFKLQINKEEYRQADYNDYLHLLYSSGVWFEGGAPITLVPDATLWSSLMSWIQDRDSYNQGKFASVYMYDPVRGIRSVVDVKVREAAIAFEKGGPVTLELSLLGKRPGSATPEVSMHTRVGPYLWKETAVTIDVGGVGSLSSTVDIESAEVRLDEHVEDAAEGLRITATNGQYPQKLYNVAGESCTGSLSRDFVDSSIYDVFESLADNNFSTDYDASIQFVMSRGGITATVLVNRMQWTTHTGDPGGTNEGRIPESLEWIGLGSDDGTTGPVTLS